ncbi:uncharacterized protein SCHCODRAFT_02362139 [Schizophyllum commune H4-8]|uniref:uncharacterized protein n=1 Tax=Schizophyllum commune (strain H4-8 / FGSC 9210) TaxID=578458 RepID=UPI00215F256B|nr:uncharacterized protein SCHCODRAFT_02362139 [Schizophyllum commune H4-8]KAI5889206.1 hypothetical protein SCHCODRAFT_02362139 [Schizophyllum commune H4-8]
MPNRKLRRPTRPKRPPIFKATSRICRPGSSAIASRAYQTANSAPTSSRDRRSARGRTTMSSSKPPVRRTRKVAPMPFRADAADRSDKTSRPRTTVSLVN